MDQERADAIAESYERWLESGDQGFRELFSSDFLDHVSGQRGLAIFDVVGRWIEESFAKRRVEHHATMHDGDRVMVWFTQHGTHIGNGLPRLAGCPIEGREVSWSQLHVFRVAEGVVIEHWAIRDDYGLIDQVGRSA